MKVVYFYNRITDSCPVKDYLKQYLSFPHDLLFLKKRKQKILADIDAKINYVKENNGLPIPPISKPLHGYNFFEILSSKDAKTLIRILYFRYLDKLVLLHAFEKPAIYNTEKERRRVDAQNKIAQTNLNLFKNNPTDYEKYN